MTMRVAPPKVFPNATRAGKPPTSAEGSADAYRQTSFVLGAEVEAVLAAMNWEGAAAAASSGAKFRSQQTAAGMGLWSRSWLYRLQALHAVEWGNYVGAMPLVRAAADSAGGMLYLLRQEMREWQEWLDEGGVVLAPERHAIEFRLHAFRAAEALAGDIVLGPIYRATSDLALPHFGATLLLTGGDSDTERIAMTFGDRDFHLGFAELVLGWLAELSAWHGRLALEYSPVFATNGELNLAALDGLVADARRCRIEIIEIDGAPRYLIHNVRRAAGLAPKRYLL
jgi:hypothetical protein